jgi:hypothetical protein
LIERAIGVTIATALFAVLAIEARWWRTFQFTDCAPAPHVICKIVLGQTVVVNYAVPF